LAIVKTNLGEAFRSRPFFVLAPAADSSVAGTRQALTVADNALNDASSRPRARAVFCRSGSYTEAGTLRAFGVSPQLACRLVIPRLADVHSREFAAADLPQESHSRKLVADLKKSSVHDGPRTD
jgi:hypothetical protein